MPLSRRSALKHLTGGAAALGLVSGWAPSAFGSALDDLKGNINHSVTRWTYGETPLDVLCREAKAMGIGSVELIDPGDFEAVLEHGLTCAMVNAPTPIERGFNRTEHHDELVAAYEERIPQTAEAGFPNLICFSGNRDGIGDEEGIENCVAGIQRIIGLAEEHGVTICMEYLNSKVDHPDYHFDHMAFGAEVVRRVGSDRFKLLYDIYHAQIMEGNVIRTIRDHADLIGHYHTGGVPGRNEIDDTQELYYPAIMEAIVETGFEGWVGQEFIPENDPMTSLREAVRRCDV